MTPDDPTTFADPKLKAAIRRTWGRETAPAALQDRIQSLLTQQRDAQGSGDVIHVAPSFWRRPHIRRLGISAAAVVVLGVGLVAFQLSGSGDDIASSSPTPTPSLTPGKPRSTFSTAGAPASVELPADLGAKIVKAHDVCVRVHPEEHHLFNAAPKDNYKLISERMAAQLKYPVVATAMGDGWNFLGASLCPVGEKRVAHMMYSRGDAHLSVFSLPASAFPGCAEHQTCDADLNGRPVAGFAEAGGFYAVVASSEGETPVDLEQVRAIRDRVRADVVAISTGKRVQYAMVTFR